MDLAIYCKIVYRGNTEWFARTFYWPASYY